MRVLNISDSIRKVSAGIPIQRTTRDPERFSPTRWYLLGPRPARAGHESSRRLNPWSGLVRHCVPTRSVARLTKDVINAVRQEKDFYVELPPPH